MSWRPTTEGAMQLGLVLVAAAIVSLIVYVDDRRRRVSEPSEEVLMIGDDPPTCPPSPCDSDGRWVTLEEPKAPRARFGDGWDVLGFQEDGALRVGCIAGLDGSVAEPIVRVQCYELDESGRHRSVRCESPLRHAPRAIEARCR